MKKLLLPVNQVTELKERFRAWKASGYLDCDKGMAPLLEGLNRHAGLCPVFSCSGHNFNPYDGEKRNFYVMFGADAIGFDALCHLYSGMREILLDLHHEAEEEKRLFDRVSDQGGVFFNPHRNVNPSQFMLTMATRRLPGTNTHYNALILSANGTWDELTRTNFINTFVTYLNKENYA